MAEQFNKLINISIDDSDLKKLEKTIQDIDNEVNNLEETSKSLTLNSEEQLKNEEQILSLLNKKEEIETKLLQTSKKQEESSVKQEKSVKTIAENLEKQQKRGEQLFKVAEGIGGAFQIASGASLLLGEQTSEAMEKAQAKVIAIISLTDGLKKSIEGLSNGYKLMKDGIDSAKNATGFFGKAMKLAVSGTGIGILLVGIALIISYFEEIKQLGKEISEAIGLDGLIDNMSEFSDKVGGITGLFTVLKGVVLGVFKEIGNVGKAIVSLFTFDSEKIKESFSKIGDDIGKEYTKAVKEATEEANYQRLLLEKEGLIASHAQNIALLKANGKETLKLEKELIEEQLSLIDLKLKKAIKNSDEEKKLLSDKAKFEVDLETNKKATLDKIYENRLKKLQTDSNLENIELNKKYKNNEINQKQYEDNKFNLEVEFLQKEINLRKKHGEDVSALQLTLSQKLLDQSKSIVVEETDLLKTEYNKRLLVIQDNFNKNLISEKQFADEVNALDLDLLEKRIDTFKEGSQERLDAQIAYNQKVVENTKTSNQEEYNLDLYYSEKEIDNLKKVEKENTKSFEQKKDNSNNLYKAQVANLDLQLIRAKKVYGEESIEYKKLVEAKQKLEEDFNVVQENLAQQQLDKTKKKIAEIGAFASQAVSSIGAIVAQAGQAQLDTINKNIEALEKVNDGLSKDLDANSSKLELSLGKLNDLEDQLADAQGSRHTLLIQQLEEQRSEVNSLQKEQDRISKAQIENEKKIQKAKDDASKKELENKKKQQKIAIAQAIINTALGVSAQFQLGPAGIALGAVVAVLGNLQIGLISSQKFRKGGKLEGNSHENGGISGTGRFANIEVEGSEFIINKKSTEKYLPLIQAINEDRVKFESGGQLPSYSNLNGIVSSGNDELRNINSSPIVVSVVDINNGQRKVNIIENSSSF